MSTTLIPRAVTRSEFIAALAPLCDLLNVDQMKIGVNIGITDDAIIFDYIPEPGEAKDVTWPQESDEFDQVVFSVCVGIEENV